MLPHDDDAKRLAANAYHFAEFFRTFDVDVPSMSGTALMWGHCHQRATGGMDAENELLTRMGLDVQPVSGGCCGLAGSWGFESGKYQISMECGEQGLLPAVRDAPPEALVVADGFSCSTQIRDAGTGREPLHLAQVMERARASAPERYPASRSAPVPAGRPAPSLPRRIARTLLPLAAAGGAGLGLWHAITGGRRTR
jgi:Fe-S oxidoreductase